MVVPHQYNNDLPFKMTSGNDTFIVFYQNEQNFLMYDRLIFLSKKFTCLNILPTIYTKLHLVTQTIFDILNI